MALINKIERECISVLQQISSIIFQAIRVHKERQRCILVIEECTKRWNDPIKCPFTRPTQVVLYDEMNE